MFPFVLELFRSTAYREHKIIQQQPGQEVVQVLQEINIFFVEKSDSKDHEIWYFADGKSEEAEVAKSSLVIRAQ